MRYRLPSAFQELPHTADVGIEVAGEDLAELYARAALGMSQLLAGGGPIEAKHEQRLVAEGEDRAALLVDFCRQVLDRFFLGRSLLAEIEIDQLSESRIEARGWFGPFDPEAHAEGVDIKAVTYGGAEVEQVEEGWRARLVFDI
ncbi:MAG: archease [Myxococcales bacterium]|jgi:SHS2 domain-containing protein